MSSKSKALKSYKEYKHPLGEKLRSLQSRHDSITDYTKGKARLMSQIQKLKSKMG